MQSKLDRQVAVFLLIQRRIEELKRCVAEEDIDVSDESVGDLFSFLAKLSSFRRPYIFLNECGQLRLIWQTLESGDTKESLSITFRGESRSRFLYNYSVEHQGRKRPCYLSGSCDIDTMLRRLWDAGYDHIWRED
jgi:hypothetical protein